MKRLAPELIDGTPHLIPAVTVTPYLHDARRPALRSQTVNLIAKRFADLMLVSGFDEATARGLFRPVPAAVPGNLLTAAGTSLPPAELEAAWTEGRIAVSVDQAARRVEVVWRDPSFDAVRGTAAAPPGYGGIVLGEEELRFDPVAIPRGPECDAAWPAGEGAAPTDPRTGSATLGEAADALLRGSPGLYGVLVASPDAIQLERYGHHGGPDRVMPSWSMTKAITATLIGRLIHLGWLGDVHAPAPAPMWRSATGIHRLITIDHLLRMRSGLAFPMLTDEGSGIGFENSFVYNTPEDAFSTAQRAIVATVPGSTYRYVNTGPNVLGAILRDQVEARGLPYPATVYGLLADRIGMTGYRHSADRFGNLVASGSGLGRLRDYARLGILYLQDGTWNGERLLPEGWVDYALAPTHTGSHYAAGFRTNSFGTFASLTRDAAWASGALSQRVIILRRERRVIVMTNEYGHPVDTPLMEDFLRAVMASAQERSGSGEATP